MEIIASCHACGREKRERLELRPGHVLYVYRRWGVDHQVAIPLGQLTSITCSHRAPVGCLMAGSFGAVGAIVCGLLAKLAVGELAASIYGWTAFFCGGIVAVLLLLFYLCRADYLELRSATETLALRIVGRRREELRAFVEQVLRQQLAEQQGRLGATALAATTTPAAPPSAPTAPAPAPAATTTRPPAAAK